MAEAYDYLIKLLLVGDSGVGKSVLFVKYVNNEYIESFITTAGVDFKLKMVQFRHKRLKLQIWDTAGQERFRTIRNAYFRGAMGFLILYDITNLNSFKNLSNWLRDVDAHGSPHANKIIVGTKTDLNARREVTHEMINAFSKSVGIDSYEISSKEGKFVDRVFMVLVEGIFNRLIQQQYPIYSEPVVHRDFLGFLVCLFTPTKLSPPQLSTIEPRTSSIPNIQISSQAAFIPDFDNQETVFHDWQNVTNIFCHQLIDIVFNNNILKFLDIYSNLNSEQLLKILNLCIYCHNIEILDVFKFKLYNFLTTYSSSLIYSAIVCEQLSVLKFMNETLNWNLNINTNNYSTVDLAIISNNIQVVEYLLQFSININLKNADGNTPLCIAAYYGNEHIGKYLLQNGANINNINNDGNSALHIAAERNYTNFVYLLLVNNCNCTYKNKAGNIAIHLAATANNFDVIAKLFEFNNNMVTLLNNNGDSFVHIAAMEGYFDITTEYHKYLTNLCNMEDNTPLMLAAFAGHASIVTALLSKLDNSAFENKEGMNALHIAAAQGHAEVIAALVTQNNCNIKSSVTGKTPLHYAVQNEHHKAAYTLMNYGAVANICDNSGQTAKDLAVGALLPLLDNYSQQNTNVLVKDKILEISFKEIIFRRNILVTPVFQLYSAIWQKQCVVVKSYTSDTLLFENEILFMSMLDHPNVLQLLGASTQKPHLCLVLEDTSDDSISLQQHKLALANRVQIALDVARGLAYLHAALPSKPSILHNDIKPSSIMITQDLKAKIGNYACAEFIKVAGKVAPNRTGVKGTGFTAPEVMRNLAYTQQADIFSFGMLLWNIIFGKLPFEKLETAAEVSSAILEGKRPPIEDTIPKKLQKLMEECWAESPSQRPTLADIIKRLGAIKLKERKRGLKHFLLQHKKTLHQNKLPLDFSKAVVGKQIGRGGSGCRVFMCNVQGVTCAVKIFEDFGSTEQLHGVCKEIDLLQTVMEDAEQHNLVKYLHRDFENGILRLFMEYMPLSLYGYIQKTHENKQTIPATLVSTLALEIAHGLHYLHTRNPPMIHRDIKAANILLDASNGNEIRAVRIADFGTSKILSLSAPKTTVGTYGFMAPEVLASNNQVGYTLAADVFAFGMLLYEMLTLQTPSFYNNIPALPQLPAEYDAIVQLFKKCTQKNPKDRPSMAQIVAQLSN